MPTRSEAQSIVVRAMRTKRASCATSGRLTFDAAPPNLPQDLQDHVVVHERLHFQVPNYGKLWKSLMRTHLGDYGALAAKLNQERH
jgi:hypothetical protein